MIPCNGVGNGVGNGVVLSATGVAEALRGIGSNALSTPLNAVSLIVVVQLVPRTAAPTQCTPSTTRPQHLLEVTACIIAAAAARQPCSVSGAEASAALAVQRSIRVDGPTALLLLLLVWGLLHHLRRTRRHHARAQCPTPLQGERPQRTPLPPRGQHGRRAGKTLLGTRPTWPT